MGKLIAILLILLCIGFIPAMNAHAANNTFSVYGTVTEDDGTPIPGTTITLSNPELPNYHWLTYNLNGSVFATYPDGNGGTRYVNVTEERDKSLIGTTVTDENGDFEFVKVTTDAEYCTLRMYYPDHKQYFPPGNSFRTVGTTGTQYVNVSRIHVESDAPPAMSVPGFEAPAVLMSGTIALAAILRYRRRGR